MKRSLHDAQGKKHDETVSGTQVKEDRKYRQVRLLPFSSFFLYVEGRD
jgi:hypothetical protein